MARHSRMFFDGAVYHVFQRGNNKNELFKSDIDYHAFHGIIYKYLKLYDCHIYHYCLMPNHFHFLLKTVKACELPKFMQGLTQSYCNYFKKMYSHCGHLYQNRYKCLLIDKPEYYLECARYIERNPIKAGFNNLPSKKWSSSHFYTQSTPDKIVSENPQYSNFGNNPSERRKKYMEFLSKDGFYDGHLYI